MVNMKVSEQNINSPMAQIIIEMQAIDPTSGIQYK
jgi:hypothetical protein